VREITGQKDVAFVVALISMSAGRGLMQTPVGWGDRVISPRFLVFGISPLLLWLYWRWRHSWLVPIPFAAFGILLFVHPRFSIYPVTLMLIGLALQKQPSAGRWPRTAVSVASFAPFLAVALWLAFDRLGTPLLSGKLQATDTGVSIEDPYSFAALLLRPLFSSLIDAAVPLSLAILGWHHKRKSQGISDDEKKAFVAFSLAPIPIYLGLLLGFHWVPALKRLTPPRFLTYAYLIPYAFAVYWLLDKWRRGGLVRRLVAVLALVAVFAVTYGQVRSLLLDDNATYRQLVDAIYEQFAPTAIREQRDAVLTEAARADDIDQDWDSFHALCDWARTNTDVESVFVVPPAHFSLFRLYSQRGLYASLKDVSRVWERYDAATAAYVSGDLADFEDLQALGLTDYVVVERDKLTLDALLVYENHRYLVYALSDSP
jgi:hypothetical protein